MAEAEEVNGWIRRAQILGSIVNQVGATTILLGVAVGWASGWIPFKPLEQINADVRTHDAAMQATTRNRENAESKTVLILERLASAITRMDRRAQIVDCARLTDADLRRRCLE